MDRRSFLWTGAAVLAAARPGMASAFADLTGPRRHLIMRHARAPGYSDPAGFRVDDCATQRNLDDRGREQARETGRRLKAAGIAVDRVFSSQWCRCLDTARLLDMATVEQAPPLNSFFEARGRADAQTRATREMLLALPAETSAMLVTHQVNISALLGRATSSGEIYAFEIAEDGATRVLDNFLVPA